MQRRHKKLHHLPQAVFEEAADLPVRVAQKRHCFEPVLRGTCR